MSNDTSIDNAVIVTPHGGATKRLSALLTLLGNVGITIELVDSPEDAAARLLLTDASAPQCVLVDALDEADGLPRSINPITRKLRDLRATVPHIAPIVVSADPAPNLVIECYRSGAGDFIDLASDTGDSVEKALARVADDYRTKVEQRSRIRELRGIVEEFLRDIVRTERRSIDLEHKLAAKETGRSVEPVNRLDSEREATVVIVEDDRVVADMLVDELENVGLTTFAFVSGEDAIHEVTKMAGRNEPIDLALIDSRLPGIDGLETLRRMRDVVADVPAILMTGYSDQETAVGAADLGVVGYVLKPFDDIAGLIERIKEQAEQSRDQGRERLYLERIKERHESVLLGYRKLASEIEKIFD